MLVNICAGQACTQSSRADRWSITDNDAPRAIAGLKDGNYSFHTATWDVAPWWQIDLAERTSVEAVVVFNREVENNESIRQRIRTLQLLVSDDGQTWTKVFDNTELPEADQLFGGIKSGPRTIWTPRLTTRFLRLALAEKQLFHFDTLEIYAERRIPTGEQLEHVLKQANGRANEIADRNLKALGVRPAKLLAVARDEKIDLTPNAIGLLTNHLLNEAGFKEAQKFVASLEDKTGAAFGRVELTKFLIRTDLPAGKTEYARLARDIPDAAVLLELHEAILAAEGKGSESAIKLIIWDLDDTLWRGTLADGDNVELFHWRRDFISRSSQHGIVHSICSKNNFDDAMRKLDEFGLTPYLVHPSISFTPKGVRVKQLISDLQLRPQNVVFVDDNHHNLHEVQHECAKIQTIDAASIEADDTLERIIANAKRDDGKRLKEYQLLSSKLSEVEKLGGDNATFLKQSGIRVAVTYGANNIPFAERIEELVNRSNQMNFLKTRIAAGTASFLVADGTTYETASVFVQDRYGSYGLVGFAAIHRRTKKLMHFAFSCRIMNMGIENHVLALLGRWYTLQDIGVEARQADYITTTDHKDPAFQSDFANAGATDRPDIFVMANCQSGILAHYLGHDGRVAAEQWPENFTLYTKSDSAAEYAQKYKVLVYGIFVDYLRDYWPAGFTLADFQQRLTFVLDAWCRPGVQIYLLLPLDSDQTAIEDTSGAAVSFAAINATVRDICSRRSSVHLVEVAKFGGAEEKGLDLRHYARTTLERVAKHIGQHIRDTALSMQASQSRVRNTAPKERKPDARISQSRPIARQNAPKCRRLFGIF